VASSVVIAMPDKSGSSCSWNCNFHAYYNIYAR